MSPSMKSKSKSKEKASKEQHKASSKTSGSTNDESRISARACETILETVQTLGTSLVDSSSIVNENSQYPKINDIDDHSSSPQGTVSEYDSVSNNGSCSGESEDTKEKVANTSARLDIIPGCDNDRRDKIRLKNERKHQRQRERRAQELHDRCTAYLMMGKIEKHAQKLVAMGFPYERATVALKLNDGKIEDSISWLLSEVKDTTNLVSEGNLKIDVSDELEHISAMEVKYNCSKQEVERVVVACEGDLQKTENALKTQKEESSMNQSEDSAAQNNTLIRSDGLQPASVSIQQRGNESDFNYYNVCGADSMFQDPENRNPQSLHMNHQNELAQKRWGASVTASNSSNMLTMSQSMQGMSPFVKMEVRPSSYRNEGRMIHQGVGREQVVLMQHPQFGDAKQNYLNSMNSIATGTSGWYVNGAQTYENTRSNGNLLLQNQNMGTHGSTDRDRLQQLYQSPYKEYSHVYGPVDSSIASGGMRGFYKPMVASSPSHTMPSHSQHHGLWNTATSSPALTVPPSLGLFCGHQNPSARSCNSHSHVDWNTGGMVQEFDYNNIDWSLDCSSSSRSSDVLLGISSLLRNNAGNAMTNSYMTGSRNVGIARETSSSSGLRDWTSPFAGKDIFSTPRKFVTFPPM